MSFFFIDDTPSGATSIAFQASATSITANITCPTVQQYDVGILFDVGGDSAPPSTVLPSGWTSISNLNVDAGSFAIRSILSYRIFDGTESGSTITGMVGNNAEPKVLLVFRPGAGSVVSSLQLQSPWNDFCADSNPSAQTISAAAQQAPLIRYAATGRVTTAPSISLTGTFDAATIVATDTNAIARVGYAVQNSSPSDDSTIDNNIASGAHSLVSGWIRFL